MTNTTLRERIIIWTESQKDYENNDEDEMISAVEAFIESELAREREEGRQEMKTKIKNKILLTIQETEEMYSGNSSDFEQLKSGLNEILAL